MTSVQRTSGERRASVLVVDDDAEARGVVVRIADEAGWIVFEAPDGSGTLTAVESVNLDLVILDLGLPDMDGQHVLDRIRLVSDVPVIVVTGRDDEDARVAALLAGADDYVTKPYSSRELLARATSLLRRARLAGAARVSFDLLEVDFGAERCFRSGQDVDLRPREFELLACLVGEPSRVFSVDELLRRVWRSSRQWQDPATVAEHIRRLRHKVEVDPRRPRWIKSRRGSGYWFEP